MSNPQPAIQWSAQGSNLAKWNIQKDQGIHKYNATSTVKIEDESNIRQYTILLKNELGWILHNVTFLPRGMFCLLILIYNKRMQDVDHVFLVFTPHFLLLNKDI